MTEISTGTRLPSDWYLTDTRSIYLAVYWPSVDHSLADIIKCWSIYQPIVAADTTYSKHDRIFLKYTSGSIIGIKTKKTIFNIEVPCSSLPENYFRLAAMQVCRPSVCICRTPKKIYSVGIVFLEGKSAHIQGKIKRTHTWYEAVRYTKYLDWSLKIKIK